MTPSLDQRGAARILDLADSRGSRSSALAGFAVVVLLAAHAAARGGFPSSAQAAAMSCVGARSAHQARAEESQAMKRLMAVGAAAAISAGVSAQHAVQWRVEDGGNGHWYCFDQEVLHWAPHRDRAMLRGAHLATVTSSGERAFLESILFIQENDIWLGGQSNWPAPMSWVTGEPFDNALWCPTGFNPGGGYAVEICGRADCINQYCWNIEGETCLCWPGNKAVYEWSADCDGDGVVDFGQIRDGTRPDGNGNNIPDCCESGGACIAPFAQWRVEDGGNGHWYMLSSEVHEWPAARARAAELGGHLATLTSAAERLFVLPLCDNRIDFDVWLGASRAGAESPIQWITGEAWSYTAWGPGSPSPESPYDYLEIVGRSKDASFGLWNLELVYAWGPGQISLIEFDADCNGDGIVDFGQIRAGELADSNANNIPDCCEIGTICGCSGDTNRDGTVDGIDLATVLTRWGQSAAKFPEADCNRDGLIDGSDLAIVLGSWGACP